MGRLRIHLPYVGRTPDTNNIYMVIDYIIVGDAHKFGEPECWESPENKRDVHIHTHTHRSRQPYGVCPGMVYRDKKKAKKNVKTINQSIQFKTISPGFQLSLRFQSTHSVVHEDAKWSTKLDPQLFRPQKRETT